MQRKLLGIISVDFDASDQLLIIARKCVIPVVCVKIGKGMLSNTTMPIKVYLMAILDNYMFRPLLAIFRLPPHNTTPINTFALQLDIYSLAHHLCKM